jgi:exosortase
LFSFAAQIFAIPVAAGILPDIKMLGIFLMAVGGFATLYGFDAFRSAAFPFTLLLLTLPLPGPLIDRIIYFLQVQSTSLAYGLFSLLGVPVYREGFILRMPGVSIEVAKECSGINSSVALLITALLVARETLRTTWRRAVLLVITVPLSVLKNAVRIVTLTLLAMYVDPSFLTGHLHHDGGFVFFLIALALVYPIWRLLQKTESQHLPQSDDPAPAFSKVLSQASSR